MVYSRRRPLRSVLLALALVFITWYVLWSERGTIKVPHQLGIKSRPQIGKLRTEDAVSTVFTPIDPLPSIKPSTQADLEPTPEPQASEAPESFAHVTTAQSFIPEASQEPVPEALRLAQQDFLADQKSRLEAGVDTDNAQDQEIQPPESNASYTMVGGKKFYPKHPVTLVQELQGLPLKLPKLQHSFEKESAKAKKTRLERLAAVKEAFQHAWSGYKEHAWLKDELRPVTGTAHQSFGGWAATLVDTLDTLWIMGMKEEFEDAVNATSGIDFSSSVQESLSVFETTIRYLGGLLGAYDISEGKYPVLLEKAKELGELLYGAFDTPNHMPMTQWAWKKAFQGDEQFPSSSAILADLGSLTLEFTRLSQLTGDMRFYDAVTRVASELQKSQGRTRIPGLWPQTVNLRQLAFTSSQFTLGALADSTYEYLPKQHMLVGGKSELVRYDKMYKFAIVAVMNHIAFQPMLPNGEDILFLGTAEAMNALGEEARSNIGAQASHLACFGGGMVGIGAKLFDQPEHMNMARKLVDGCIWAYNVMPSGVMPESFALMPCDMNSDCKWDQDAWEARLRSTYPPPPPIVVNGTTESTPDERSIESIMAYHRLPLGIPSINEHKYLLRPEAIESVFVHYRLTGDEDLPDKAWQMFTAIENATRTDIAHSAIADVTQPASNTHKLDGMESFWLAETLKYFYLMFSEPDVVNLDTFVLNTEAHPLRRPEPGKPFVKGKKD